MKLQIVMFHSDFFLGKECTRLVSDIESRVSGPRYCQIMILMVFMWKS